MYLLHSVITFAFVLGVCTANADESPEVIDFLQKFSVNLFKWVLRENEGNVAVSPLSAYIVRNAARDELFADLRYKYNNVGPVKFGLSNDPFSDESSPMVPLFKNPIINESYIHRVLKNPDEKFIPDNDSQKIKFDVKEPNDIYIDTLLQFHDLNGINIDNFKSLLNYGYFHGVWEKKFEKLSDMWFLINGTYTEVPSMSITAQLNCGEIPELGVNFVQVPYESGDMKMIVIVPKVNATIELFEEMYDFRTLNYVMYSHQRCIVNLKMPKFEMKSTVFLKKIMKKMGYVSDSDDLTQIPEDTLIVNKMKQSVSMKVNEHGKKETQDDEINVEKNTFLKVCLPNLNLEVNQPSIFLVVKKNSVIIMGRIANPLET